MRHKTASIVALLALVLSACASMRKVDVTSDPGTSYRISVHNSRSSAVTVSYTTGTTTRELGVVGAGQTVQFVVISATPQITITARTSGGTTLSPKTVSLAAGSTTSVTLN